MGTTSVYHSHICTLHASVQNSFMDDDDAVNLVYLNLIYDFLDDAADLKNHQDSI